MRVPVGIVSKTPRAASVIVVAKVVVDGARRSQLLRAGLLAVVGIDHPKHAQAEGRGPISGR